MLQDVQASTTRDRSGVDHIAFGPQTRAQTMYLGQRTLPSSFVDCFTKPARRRTIAHANLAPEKAQAAAQKTRGAPGTMDVARGTVVVAIGTGAVPIGTCAVAMGTGFV